MKHLLLFASILLFSACNQAPTPVTNTNPERPIRTGQAQNMTAHTTENQPPNQSGSKWSQSGDPIDTTSYDKLIADSERDLKSKPADEGAKKATAQAYFDRGLALTNARQYASAIGDYRRALKFDPDHAESKKWIDQILSIYGMLKKEAPKEGEEPPPLPFRKTA